MSMVDLKLTRAEAKEEMAEAPEYSWGLTFRLEKEELDKLGVADLPDVGDQWHMEIVATITGVSQQKMADGDEEQCVTCQITMASVVQPEEAPEPAPAPTPRATRSTPSLLTGYTKTKSSFTPSAGAGFTKRAFITNDQA